MARGGGCSRFRRGRGRGCDRGHGAGRGGRPPDVEGEDAWYFADFDPTAEMEIIDPETYRQMERRLGDYNHAHLASAGFASNVSPLRSSC